MTRLSRITGALLVAAALLAVAPGEGRSEVLSFESAVKRLETRSRPLMAAVDRETARRAEKSAARGLRMPSIRLDARATRLDDPLKIDLDPIRSAMLALHPTVPSAAVPAFLAEVQGDKFFKAGLEMTWPIFTGGAITAANRAADARLRDARQQTRSIGQTLRADLVDRYFGLCLAEQARVLRRQIEQGLQEHLFHAQRLEAEGLISRAERLHAEVSHAEAARALQAAEHDVRLASAALRTLLHEDIDPQPSTRLFVTHDLPALEDLQREAVAANPDLQRLSAQKALAESGLKAERSDYLPQVALFARYELYPDDLTALDPRWAAGIGLQLNIFDGFARRHRVEAARATVSMVDHIQQGAQSDIALLVEHNYRRVIKATESFDTLASTIELAEENLRVRRRAFEEGLASSLDVVDAINMLSGVELARLAAAHDFVTALADLLSATGHADHFIDYLQSADTEVIS